MVRTALASIGFLLQFLVAQTAADDHILANSMVFDEASHGVEGNWIFSENPIYNGKMEAADDGSGSWTDGGNVALHLANPNSRYGASIPFNAAYDPDQPLVIQYMVQHKDGWDCGGSYVKLITHPRLVGSSQSVENHLKGLNPDTPYSVMFGPDKCGSTNKVHFIVRHQNPLTKEWEEKHFNDGPPVKADKFPHLYTLVLRTDNTFDILIDNAVAATGSLLNDLSPPINPSATIDDLTDKQPDDWVEDEMIKVETKITVPKFIVDNTAEMPHNWKEDEPPLIPDPTAERPIDWDVEEDGVWEAPEIDNPACTNGCGPWSSPLIPNPDYKDPVEWKKNPEWKGEWKPRQIPNPHMFVDARPHRIAEPVALSLEVWSVDGGVFYDNLVVTTDVEGAKQHGDSVWRLRYEAEKEREDRELAAARAKALQENYSLDHVDILKYWVTITVEMVSLNPFPALVTVTGSVMGTLFLGASYIANSKTRKKEK